MVMDCFRCDVAVQIDKTCMGIVRTERMLLDKKTMVLATRRLYAIQDVLRANV